LEVWVGEPGTWCAVDAPKWRALLAVLLARRGQPVSIDQLVREIWGQEPPAHARKLVSLYVLRLRRLLADPAGGWLVTRSPGYLLRCGAGDVDAGVFETMVAAGRRELDAGRLGPAADTLSAATALWRGAVLADVPQGPLLRAEGARLGELRLQAIQLRIEADLGCGREDSAVAELRALVTEHRLQEGLWGLLVRALAGAGRRAEAEQAYAQARQAIGEELGAEPGRELRELHRLLLAGEDLRPSVAARPSASSTAGNHATGASSSGPDLHEPVCQLPPDVDDFTGRSAECAQLTELLSPAEGRTSVPVAVVSGQPGVGKTALALHVAHHRLRGIFADGQLFAKLAGASSRPREPGDVLGEMLQALGTDPASLPETTEQRAALFRSRLAGRAVLLVADDAASPAQVLPLLPGTAGCAVIVTSRIRLAGLGGAQLFVLDCLGRDEAVEMLGRIVGARRVAAERRAAAGLVAACGQLPLAVRIAGARLATRPLLPVAKVASLISDERRRLDELAIGGLAVRARIAASYAALDERAKRAFRLLGLLGPPDFAPWVIAALLAETDAADVIDILEENSLLTPTGIDATGEARYRMHGLLRDYAAEVAAKEPPNEVAAALDRLLTGYTELARLAHQRLPSLALVSPDRHNSAAVVAEDVAARLTARPAAWFVCERLNLPAAIKLARASGRHQIAARLASCVPAFQLLQNRADHARADQPLGRPMHQLHDTADGVVDGIDGGHTGRSAPGYSAGPGNVLPSGTGTIASAGLSYRSRSPAARR
jgi:DNA-binding SARP family transcriptional activator